MFWVLLFLFILYVVYSLAVIKSKLNLIQEHLNIKFTPKFSEEEIEMQKAQDLFDELNC